MKSSPLISIIIPNFNYAEFISEAIQSVLNSDWPCKEVIVVDDGSTDASRRIINYFEKQVTLINSVNRGQFSAYNLGFTASNGEWILFLDSDDTIEPDLFTSVSNLFRTGVSKIQVQMKVIDRESRFLNRYYPYYPKIISEKKIREMYIESLAYPCPPGSGNIYSRGFLQKIFPLNGLCGKTGDSQPLAAAPILGDVVTVNKPLVNYRVHGNNLMAFTGLSEKKLRFEISVARNRASYAVQLAADNYLFLKPEFSLHSLRYFETELLLKKCFSTSSYFDCLKLLLAGNIFKLYKHAGLSFVRKIFLFFYVLSLVVLPKKLALKLAKLRHGKKVFA